MDPDPPGGGGRGGVGLLSPPSVNTNVGGGVSGSGSGNASGSANANANTTGANAGGNATTGVATSGMSVTTPGVTSSALISKSELNAGLIAAAKLGKRSLVCVCLSKGADVDFADTRGLTALHYSAMNGHHAVVDVLLQQGAADSYAAQMERSADDPNRSRMPRVFASPLHLAVLRGAVRCVWLLVAAGYATTDTDQCGNNALHLACCCTIPSAEDQLEILRTVMSAGFDPEARNWHGMRAVDMLPSHAVEARRLLLASHAQTKCYSTGTPFGREELRYLCHSSGHFFSEEASVSMNVRAFVENKDVTKPVRLGAEVVYRVADAEASLESSLNPFGLAGLEAAAASTLAAAGNTITGFSSPIRAGAAALRALVDSNGPPASPTRAGAGSPAAGARGFGGDSGGELPPPAPTPSPRRGVPHALTPLERGVTDAIAEVDEEEEDESEEDASTRGSAGPGARAAFTESKSAEGREGDVTERAPIAGEDGAVTGGDAGSDDVQPNAGALEIELYFTPDHVSALEAAISQVAQVHGDVALIDRGKKALARLEAARRLREAVVDMTDSRPLKRRSDVAACITCLASAASAGVGNTLQEEARTAIQLAVAETELGGALEVCKAIAVATHAYDADIARLRSAVETARGINARAVSLVDAREASYPASVSARDRVDGEHIVPSASAGSLTSGRQSASIGVLTRAITQDRETASVAGSSVSASRSLAAPSDRRSGAQIATGRSSAMGHPTGLQSSAASVHGATAASPGPPELAPDGKPFRTPAAAIPIVEVDTHLVEEAAGLLQRLRCEVGVTDAVAAAEAAAHVLAEARAAHDAEDASLLPVPELPAEELAAVQAAIAAAAAAAAAPPPPPKRTGGKVVPPPPGPPPGPVFPPTSVPLDPAGVPLPTTPQLEAILALRKTCDALGEIVASARTSGADAACITEADTALHRLRLMQEESMTHEQARVKQFREERAKAEKKARKSKKK